MSAVLQTQVPMDRAVLSWNARTPGKSAVTLQLRARGARGGWSPWFTMGVWGRGIASHSVAKQQNRFGSVDIDTLVLRQPATQWQYRLRARQSTDGEHLQVTAVAVAWKNSHDFAKHDPNTVMVSPHRVPAVSQFAAAQAAQQPALGGRICSPTSVTMLLRHLGVAADPLAIAARVYDATADAYGNWSFNTAVLAEQAPTADAVYVRWYDSFDDVLLHMQRAQGLPAIVSIGFKDGELAGAPRATPGHLVVVRGADRRFVYVNDPAAPDARTVARRYPRDQFVRAWKGVAYILER